MNNQPTAYDGREMCREVCGVCIMCAAWHTGARHKARNGEDGKACPRAQ